MYIVYRHFDRSLHIGSSDTTYVEDFRHVIFEILGFKLKNRNDKNWRNGLFVMFNSNQILGTHTY